MKKTIGLFAAGALVLALSACGGAAPAGSAGGAKSLDQLVVGFAQVGAESGWRTANTKDIQAAFADAKIKLQFSDAQQKQENQIKAIRSYIQQKVDYIAFSPVVQTGWDAVLNEAKAANIPVILTDRAVDSKDTSLYKTFLGSDFVLEGKKAGEWLVADAKGASAPVNVIQLEGTTGSAPAIDRGTGFADAIKSDPNIKVVASQTGDFTRAGGKQVAEALLKSHPEANVIFAQNDDMGLGAIEAIEAAGKVPGKDIKIITVDAVHDGMQALVDGKINYIVECNPLLGDQAAALVKDVLAGKSVEKQTYGVDGAFDQAAATAALPTRKY